MDHSNPAGHKLCDDDPAERSGLWADTERLSASGKDAKDPAYYLYDGRGGVSETARQGKAELTLRYDASRAILSGAPAQDHVFAHNGEEYTPQTGLTYLRARFYDPAQGRFTTEDVYLGNQTRSLSQNRYAYCENAYTILGGTIRAELNVKEVMEAIFE